MNSEDLKTPDATNKWRRAEGISSRPKKRGSTVKILSISSSPNTPTTQTPTKSITMRRQSNALIDFQIKQQETREWIEEVIEETLPDEDLGIALRDGVALAKLMKKIAPNLITVPRPAKAAFLMMQNIEAFTKACVSYGVTSVFMPADLVNGTNMKQVIATIQQLADVVRFESNFFFVGENEYEMVIVLERLQKRGLHR